MPRVGCVADGEHVRARGPQCWSTTTPLSTARPAGSGSAIVGGRADTDYDRLGVQVRAVCEFATADVAVTGEGNHVHVVRNRTPRPPMHVEEHVGDAFAR